MPIRKFEYYGHLSAVHKFPITLLDNTTIAIDGFWYCRKYLSIPTEPQFTDHLSILTQFLAPIVELRKKTSIIWIWDGLEYKQPIHVDFKKFIENISVKLLCRKFNRMLFDQELFVEHITRILHENNISVIRAPYLASAQCAYLLKNNCVTYVFSKNDALLYNDCNKLILEFDFPNSRIDVINRDDMLSNNHFNLEIFRRIAFLSGCEVCSTIPMYATNFDLLAILDIVKNNDLKERLAGFQKNIEAGYLQEYYRSFIIVDFHPVMHLDGTVKCLNEAEAPCDLDLVFGRRLTNEQYQDVFNCSLGVKALSIYVFQRPRDKFKDKILDAFENVLNNGIRANKNEKISDCLKRFFDIEWSNNVNRIAQIIFMNIINDDFDNASLLRLLNSGTSKEAVSVSVDNDLFVLSQKYSVYNLEVFYKASEYAILLGDLISLIKCKSRMEDDLPFDFTYTEFYKDLNRLIFYTLQMEQLQMALLKIFKNEKLSLETVSIVKGLETLDPDIKLEDISSEDLIKITIPFIKAYYTGTKTDISNYLDLIVDLNIFGQRFEEYNSIHSKDVYINGISWIDQMAKKKEVTPDGSIAAHLQGLNPHQPNRNILYIDNPYVSSEPGYQFDPRKVYENIKNGIYNRNDRVYLITQAKAFTFDYIDWNDQDFLIEMIKNTFYRSLLMLRSCLNEETIQDSTDQEKSANSRMKAYTFSPCGHINPVYNERDTLLSRRIKPTMSMDEYTDIVLKDMKEREKTQQKVANEKPKDKHRKNGDDFDDFGSNFRGNTKNMG